MNKQCHKVIFNKTTGRMDVVSEIVSAQGGATLASANEHPHPAWHGIVKLTWFQGEGAVK